MLQEILHPLRQGPRDPQDCLSRNVNCGHAILESSFRIELELQENKMMTISQVRFESENQQNET